MSGVVWSRASCKIRSLKLSQLSSLLFITAEGFMVCSIGVKYCRRAIIASAYS